MTILKEHTVDYIMSCNSSKPKKKLGNGNFCCVPHCDNTGRTPDIFLYALPSGMRARGCDTKEWRENMLKLLYQLRSPHNNHFKEKVESRKAFICSAHFKDEDIHRSKLCFSGITHKLVVVVVDFISGIKVKIK